MSEEETLFQRGVSLVLENIFSLVIPVSILLYVAPQKSLEFVTSNLKSKIEFVETINLEDISNTAVDVWQETVPMLQTEAEFGQTLVTKAPGFFAMLYSGISFVPWEYLAIAAVAIGILAVVFPWGKLLGFLSTTLWLSLIHI
eukprot:TRINITY_DN3003_c0_g4_i5.p1 TRINITY_DN3003_c0_g4~~TRINITY_DN3003_c0_g4_i5.p1  ORF type:complete len:143 (-),score=23.30 TRINITY_DN3003_c0_g4_i5:26-454(-)